MTDLIPEGITRNNIIDAIEALDNGIKHQFSGSTSYDVLYNGRRYAPKAVVRIAASYILETQLGPYDFKGGLNSKCFKVLESNQLEIVTKGDTTPFPEVIENPGRYFEGAVTQVTVNRYERDPNARAKCIKHFGAVCQVCTMDFKKSYGTIGEGFIHVHHLTQLSDVGEKYEINPVTDLLPVCPNCHAMLHKRRPPFSVQELKVTLYAKED